MKPKSQTLKPHTHLLDRFSFFIKQQPVWHIKAHVGLSQGPRQALQQGACCACDGGCSQQEEVDVKEGLQADVWEVLEYKVDSKERGAGQDGRQGPLCECVVRAPAVRVGRLTVGESCVSASRWGSRQAARQQPERCVLVPVGAQLSGSQ